MPTTMVSIELTRSFTLPWTWYDQELSETIDRSQRIRSFVREISKGPFQEFTRKEESSSEGLWFLSIATQYFDANLAKSH